MDLKEKIIKQAAPDLAKIETALEQNLTPNLALVKQIASHLLFSGGKRLRPLLMVSSARLCNYSGGLEYEFSTIFEYLHAATLLHDDVVDSAQKRRGKQAAHQKWAAPKVVLTGDFLFATALDIAARTRAPEIISIIANITREMSQGEIDQLEQKGRVDLTESEYYAIIQRKTAVLIQGACQSGAVLANTGEDRQQALDRFGLNLGLAFQMADDLLDYTADETEMGKTPGADIREGKLTLPLIHSLSHASSADRAWIEQMIKQENFTPEEFEVLKEKLHQYNGIEYTRHKAKMHAETAKQCLKGFTDSPSKTLLCDIADYAVKRKV